MKHNGFPKAFCELGWPMKCGRIFKKIFLHVLGRVLLLLHKFLAALLPPPPPPQGVHAVCHLILQCVGTVGNSDLFLSLGSGL
jgi:hypothetical protein